MGVSVLLVALGLPIMCAFQAFSCNSGRGMGQVLKWRPSNARGRRLEGEKKGVGVTRFGLRVTSERVSKHFWHYVFFYLMLKFFLTHSVGRR